MIGLNYDNAQHYLAPKECKYTYRGENLVAMRKAKLRPLAKALKVELDDDPNHNELVQRIMKRADALDREPELADV